MSPSGRAVAARLRRAVADIEALSGHGPAEKRAVRRLPLMRAIDGALGGGLADDALHEIVPAEPVDGAAAMGFALALAARFLSERASAALLIGEGFAAREMGAPYGPGLVAHGLPLKRLVFVERARRQCRSLGDGGGAEIRRRPPRSSASSGASSLTASPPRAACCSPRAKGGRRRSSCWRALTARPGGCRAPPRRGSRSPLCRAKNRLRRPAGTCRAPSPAAHDSSRRASAPLSTRSMTASAARQRRRKGRPSFDERRSAAAGARPGPHRASRLAQRGEDF